MTRKQHWVPQFYLRHFADSSGRLYAYRRMDDKFFTSKTGDVCAERDLYEVRYSGMAKGSSDGLFGQNLIEEHLSALEDKIAPLYAQLLDCCEKREFEGQRFREGRAAACALAAHLIIRHPESMRDDRKKAREFASELQKDFCLTKRECEALDELGWRGDYRALSEWAAVFAVLFSKDENAPFNRTLHAFLEKQFSVFEAPAGVDFVTASTPMFIIGPEDDSYAFDIAYMPLSSKYAMVFFDKGCFPCFGRLDYLGVAFLNRLMFLNCRYWDIALSRTRGPLERTVRDWKMRSGAIERM